MARLFPDSKTFVDMKLKYPPEKTTTAFHEFFKAKNGSPSTEELREWVDNHFEGVGKEFEPWVPPDWKEHPEFLEKILDPDLKEWASYLNKVWLELGRKMIKDVYEHPLYYSIIPVDHPVIVPGGRFIEFYYWDSYWINRGLLYCEMFQTVKGMIINFNDIVRRFNFVPNGGRVYYSHRSQPPLLAAMIDSYVEFTQETQFAIDSLEFLEREFEYWVKNHTINLNGHNVFRYGDASTGPRPESYSEDVETASHFHTPEEKENIYAELKAAAASGMDFTSRWFINSNGTREGNLTNLKTRCIIPVELNAMLYHYAKIIALYHGKANNTAKQKEYECKADKIFEAIQAIHWSTECGVWLDYDLINNRHRKYFVPTNLSPLWLGAFDKNDSEKISKSVMEYIENLKLDQYPGGVPNTLYFTGEQWDFPNVWAPMQYLLVEGLNNLGTEEAKQMATKWAHRWVKANYEAFRLTGQIFEKYNAAEFGGNGVGGEYGVQKGFGWSNAVIIEFLAKYGNEITLSTSSQKSCDTS